ncbi:MAG: antitoxin VapB family protein [Nanoarchaeota archaeon]
MGTTSITITEEAYHYLKTIKGERSFSEVILGMSRSSEDIMRFAGAFKHIDLSEVANARKAINKDWNNRH